MATANGENQSVLNVPVEFGGVSIGKTTCRLGVSIDRSKLNIVAADEVIDDMKEGHGPREWLSLWRWEVER